MAFMIAAVLSAASAATPAAAPPSAPAATSSAARADCVGNLCNVASLDAFFRALASPTRATAPPVHIMQVGDSHTAGDMITNGWRTVFQARYGFGGRGVLAPGRPYRGVITFGVTHSMSEGWTVNSNFGRAWRSDGPPIGLAGFSLTTSQADERMGVTTDTPDQNFDRLTVCGVARPGGGAVLIQMGTKVERFDLAADGFGAKCLSVETDWRVSAAQLTTEGSGVVTITSFATFARKGGVVLSNLGVSGSQLVHLGREDDRVIAAELAEYRPDLIVLAFGTNEGFSQDLTPAMFEYDLRAQVTRIRRLAGYKVPILLIGAPDAATSTLSVADNFGSPSTCPAYNDKGYVWYTPTLLAAVRERQRRVAREMGLGFWDWNAAMGGQCSAGSWRNADPPLMRGDHVHFTRAGGTRIGGMIFNDVDAAYRASFKALER